MRIPPKIRQLLPFDLTYYSQGAFWLGLGQTISTGLTFVLSVVTANLLSPAIYGSYRYVLSIYGICALFSLTETISMTTRAISQGAEGAVQDALRLKVRWGAWGTLAGLGIAGYYVIAGNHEFALVLALAAFLIPFNETFGLFDAILQGKREFRASMVYAVLIQTGSALSMIVAMIFWRQLVPLVLISLSVPLFLKAIALYRTLRTHPLNNRKDQHLRRLSIHLSSIKAISIISGTLYSLFLFHRLGAVSLGIFLIALAPIEQIRGLLSTAENLLLPKISSSEWNLHPVSFLKKLGLATGIVGIGSAMYISLAPWLFHTVFPQYTASIIYTQWYAVSLVFTFISIVFISLLRARGDVRALHAINVTAIVINIGFIIPMIHWFGIGGAVFSIIIMKIVEVGLMSYFIFSKKRLIRNDHLSNVGDPGILENQ